MKFLWVALVLGCSGSKPETDTAPSGTETPSSETEEAEPVAVRFATFNVSLYGTEAGEISELLADGSNSKGQMIASILQEVRPEVLLINELDYDADGLAASRLYENFLAVGQGDSEPLEYPHIYVAPSNTGVHAGFDLDNSGATEATPGSAAYGGDAYGFGEYEGQYAFAVFSKYPISTRTFQQFLWKDIPGADLPPGWFDDEELDVVRISSKNHVDVSVEVGDSVVHFLVSHPTPPTFDGTEDRNGRRNHDEIKFWADYLGGGAGGYHVDDAGVSGALEEDAHFVIAGDLNADPVDGDSTGGAIDQLLEHALVADPTPTSLGGEEQSALQGQANGRHEGDPAQDTADFNDQTVGNLRLDYVLPSKTLTTTGSGVFWPEASDPMFEWVGLFPFPVSDHRSVWVDVEVPQ